VLLPLPSRPSKVMKRGVIWNLWTSRRVNIRHDGERHTRPDLL
jgi:hypothetical protein